MQVVHQDEYTVSQTSFLSRSLRLLTDLQNRSKRTLSSLSAMMDRLEMRQYKIPERVFLFCFGSVSYWIWIDWIVVPIGLGYVVNPVFGFVNEIFPKIIWVGVKVEGILMVICFPSLEILHPSAFLQS